MANPQPTDAHLRVAHSINEAVMMRDFTKRQRKLLDLILRLSWGCNKKYAIIPKQRDFQIVGIGEGHIKAELTWLTQSNVITITGDNYSFNKDFDQWQVSRVRPFAPDKLTELVSINLNGHSPELTETVSLDKENLPKGEVGAYRKGKFATPTVVSPKERGVGRGGVTPLLNKVLKKETLQKGFDAFWLKYPKRKSKGQAEKAFAGVKPDEQLLAIMLATIERAKKSAEWLKDGGKFIPHPATWLNAKGWEDEFTDANPGAKSKFKDGWK